MNLLHSIKNSLAISWKTSKIYFILRITTQYVNVLLPILFLYYMKELINRCIMDVEASVISYNEYIWILSIMLLINLVQKIFEVFANYLTGLHSAKIRNYIDLEIINKTRKLDISFFDSPKFYNELHNVSTDSYSLDQQIWLSLEFVKTILQFGTAIILLLAICNWQIGVFFLLSIPYFFVSKHFIITKYNWQRSEASSFRKRSYISYIMKNKDTAKETMIVDYSDILVNWFNESWQTWFSSKKLIEKKESLLLSIVVILPEIGKVGLIILVLEKVLTQNLSIGDFSFYIGIINQLSLGIYAFARILSSILKEENNFFNYNKFLNWENKLKDLGNVELLKVDSIEFREVSFKYPGNEEYSLHKISFNVKSNQNVAIVGHNGAGKSTILNLLLRLYDVDHGVILINNKDIRQYTLTSLRRQFSVMFQDYPHYAFTLKETIGLFDWYTKNRDERIYDVCKKLGLASLLRKLPKGLDTHITRRFDMKNGVELSVGEKQKIAIAKVFFRRSSIVVLDEPSSSLDAYSEKEIYDFIHNNFENNIMFYVSHRLSNVTKADHILVLSDGIIVEQGSHSSLLKRKGLYSDLFNIQAERYK